MKCILSLLIIWIIASPVTSWSVEKNGFDLGNSLISINEILQGGPPKDGIPALNQPRFVATEDTSFLNDSDRVLGLKQGDQAKAYPIKILNWHEVVNDSIDTLPVAITYCPLCGTGAAFYSEVEDIQLEFGVSGLLYNSDVLLYDRQTESLWSQIQAQAISGSFAGTKLVQLPLIHTSWKQWRNKHPQGDVLSLETGHQRDYNRDPYAGYAQSDDLYFPVAHTSDALLDLKETVLGVKVGNRAKAYPFSVLANYGEKIFTDRIGDNTITIQWDHDGYSASASSQDNTPMIFLQGYWFAWYAFYPESEIFALPAE